MHNRSKAALAAVTLLLVLGAAGCSAGSTAPPSAQPTASATVETADGGSASGNDDTATGEPTAPAGEGVIRSTNTLSCETSKGPVSATGTVELSDGKAGDVRISVSWVKESTHAVIARGETTVEDVKPGKPVDWKINAKLPKSKGIICVTGALLVD